MSLKARIEAVVYAADEPVTIAQLASLFADEALAWKQEHEALAAAAREQEAAAAKSVEPMGGDLPLDATGNDPAADHAAANPETSASEATLEPAAETPAGPEDDPALDPDAVSAADPNAEVLEALPAAEPTAADLEAEAKRAARQRDREIRDILRGQLDELIEEYAKGDRGLEIREIAGGYRFGTKPECHDAVRSFVKSLKPPMKLSLQALETLAVIAYKQPVTAPEVSEIRGVDSSGVLGSLISRKLIATAGRKQVIGRPILYKTSKEFLLRFGLKDLNELPSIEEFEKMAGELAETDEEVEAQNGLGGDRELPFADTTEENEASVSEAATEAPAGTAAAKENSMPEADNGVEHEASEHPSHRESAVAPAPVSESESEIAHRPEAGEVPQDMQETVAREGP